MAGIVILDESPAWNAVLTAVLREAGHRAQAATSLPDALRLCQERRECRKREDRPPSLILVELVLRHGNGYSIASFLQRRTGVPAALMVSRRQPAEKRWAMTRGLAGVLVRPLPAEEMQRCVAELLQVSQAGEGAR